MKRTWILGLGVVAILSACNSEEIEVLKAEKVELEKAIQDRDLAVYDLTEGLASIQGSIRDITLREDLLTDKVVGNSELAESPKEQILKDIIMVDELIKRNQSKVDELANKLKRSDGKIYEFEKIVANLKLELLEKEKGLMAFKENLVAMEESYADLFDEYQAQLMVSTIQDEALHKVYFAYGSKSELEEMNVIEKEGGVLGLGSSLKLKDDFNKDYFTEMDEREFNSIPLQTEKVELISAHPKNSYELLKEDKVFTELIITDPSEFWSGSKYLAVLVQ